MMNGRPTVPFAPTRSTQRTSTSPSARNGQTSWEGRQRDELFPEYPFPWGLESHEEFYEVQEKLEKFAVRLVSKMQDAKGRGKSLEGWDRHPTGRGRLDLKLQGSTKDETMVILGSLPPSKDLSSMCWGKHKLPGTNRKTLKVKSGTQIIDRCWRFLKERVLVNQHAKAGSSLLRALEPKC